MQQTTRLRLLVLGAVITLAGCGDVDNAPTVPALPNAGTPELAAPPTLADVDSVRVIRASGDIAEAIAEYRALLGTLNPNVAGEQDGGRREVNWEAPIVPATLTNNDLFPGDFFNTVSPRGLLLTTDGSAFRISDISYTDLNPAYFVEFRSFSGRRLIATRGGTVVDVHFAVAGSSTPALVTGFGAVFADVELPASTTLEYFDAAGNQLLKILVPRRSDARGHSFAGARFPSAIVARVRITAGNTPIDGTLDDVTGPGEKRDIVVMDDFIYGEPRSID